MTTDEIFNQKIQQKIQGSLEKVLQINAVFQFDVTGDVQESWTIDLTKPTGHVTQGAHANPSCVVTIALKDLADIVDKKLNPQMAYMTGKLKVKGNMGLALKLGAIL